MSTTPAATSTDPSPVEDDGDWLGYGAYADALWSRIETALAKDLIKGDLGDDPLVIGIFGEWGAGKSYLLRLMHDQAKDYAKQRLGWHKRDTGFGLTVPVVFQPWKYEHETHLHVPLMLHIFHALQKYEEDAQVTSAKVAEWTGDQWEAAKKALPGAVEKFKSLLKASIAAMEPSTAGSAALGLGTASVLASTLKPAEEKPDPLKTFKYSEDGRFFYEIHQALQDVTRPTRKNGQKRKYRANDIAINFVVFVDDLDRCLPEKAVQTLELIKTMFNIESFAFVLALDDEVIERGIGHRYQAYNFAGKKPEMPITGFEYLEKIVHLPFRLPALTVQQAERFVRKYEESIEKDNLRQWFAEPARMPLALAGTVELEPIEQVRATHQATDLLALAFKGFDSYVPRKLIRMVELVHQLSRIRLTWAGHTAGGDSAASPKQYLLASKLQGGTIDQRVVLVLVLIQLFQPELFRLVRRRDRVFTALLTAFASDANIGDGTIAKPELDTHDLSDVDLWRWAIFGAKWQDAGSKFEPADNNNYWVQSVAQQIALAHADNRRESAYAQQRRLPLVAQIVEHRAAQRHVFDVLKLMEELANQLGKSKASALQMQDYFSLLVQLEPGVGHLAVTLKPVTLSATGTVGVPPEGGRARFSIGDLSKMAQDLTSERGDVQAGIGSTYDLRQGQWLQSSDVHRLVDLLGAEISPDNPRSPGKQLYLLYGLRYLAPYLSLDDAQRLWTLVQGTIDLQGDAEIEPKDRALWGDVRAALGCDPRFEASGLCLARKDTLDPATAFDTTKDLIPGFAYIDARLTPFWFAGGRTGSAKAVRLENIREPFYMARTLTTVAQYRQFVDSGDYGNYFKGEGLQWIQGSYNSRVSEKEVKEWLAKRPVLERRKPYQWEEQLRNPLRPVVHVSWFEAQAYANWLQQQLQDGAWPSVKVALPTELQWECAARFGHSEAPTPRPFPWVKGPGKADDDKALFGPYANISGLVGAPSVVGLYPKGNTPMGLTDMAGNVWEWMVNLHVDDFDPRQEISDQVTTDAYSLRGGAWFALPHLARCSCRYWDQPDDWGGSVGFRVVLSLAEQNMATET